MTRARSSINGVQGRVGLAPARFRPGLQREVQHIGCVGVSPQVTCNAASVASERCSAVLQGAPSAVSSGAVRGAMMDARVHGRCGAPAWSG